MNHPKIKKIRRELRKADALRAPKPTHKVEWIAYLNKYNQTRYTPVTIKL